MATPYQQRRRMQRPRAISATPSINHQNPAGNIIESNTISPEVMAIQAAMLAPLARFRKWHPPAALP